MESKIRAPLFGMAKRCGEFDVLERCTDATSWVIWPVRKATTGLEVASPLSLRRVSARQEASVAPPSVRTVDEETVNDRGTSFQIERWGLNLKGVRRARWR